MNIKMPEYKIIVNNNDGILTGKDSSVTLKNTFLSSQNLDDLNNVIGVPIEDSTLVYDANAGVYETRRLDYSDLTGTPDVGANTIDGGTF